jgi:hypothetical protein
MRQVTDDFGNEFRRGVPTALNVHDWQMLSKSAASGSFLFLKPEAPKAADACCADRADTQPASSATLAPTQLVAASSASERPEP